MFMRGAPCFISVDEAEGFVFSTGMDLKAFAAAMLNQQSGILILKGCPQEAMYDARSNLAYIPPEGVAALAREWVYGYGDFCWVDVPEGEGIRKLTEAEIAALLFAAHMKRPLEGPFLRSIGNEYLYLAHDDDYWAKVYMRDVRAYRRALAWKIREHFLGGKRGLAPIPEEMLDAVFEYSKGGAVLYFEMGTLSSEYTGIRILPMRDVDLWEEAIHSEMDRQRGNSEICKWL